MEKQKEINVTEATLPPKEAYAQYIDKIFSSRWLTNHGALIQELEKKLCAFLDVPYVALCANGTLSLQLSLRLLKLNGKKIITTPYTYVATLSSLLWEKCEPVFVDINPETMCLDPQLVEEWLDMENDVAGIMPVHVYGNACDIPAFDRLAKKYQIPVLYDGAHAFGSLYKGRSLLSYGHIAICSFHATKLFHTIEGGCIITHSAEEDREARLLRAFGHINDTHYSLGINAKLSEPHAAMGLALLPIMPDILKRRTQLTELYDQCLKTKDNPALRGVRLQADLVWNHAYYPVIFADAEMRVRVMKALEKEKIHPRRYFYPALTRLPYIHGQSCPIAEDISERVLCLPLWPDMPEELVERISGIILDHTGR